MTSQGESRFAWMAGAFYEDVEDGWHYGDTMPNLMQTTAWDVANYYACYGNQQGYDIACPLAPTDIYYSDKYRKTIKQTAVFGEVTYDLTDKWSITGGARWFEYDRNQIETYNVPLGLPVHDIDFEGGGVNASEGKESDTVFKFGTEFHLDDNRMIYFLYSEGFRLGGSNSERAAATGLPAAELRVGQAQQLRGWPQEPMAGRDGALSTSRFLHGVGPDPAQLSGSDADNPFWLRGTFNGGKAEQKGVEINGAWQVTSHFSLEASAFFADPEFSEETVYPIRTKMSPSRPVPSCRCRRRKSSGSPSNTRCPISWTWTARPVDTVVVQLPGRSLGQHRRHLDFVKPHPEERAEATRPLAAVVLDVHVPAGFHGQFRLGNGADRPQSLRRDRLQLHEQQQLRRFAGSRLGRPALPVPSQPCNGPARSACRSPRNGDDSNWVSRALRAWCADCVKLVTTSVVRGSHQGESHGGVYLLDLQDSTARQTLDWNTIAIDWQGVAGTAGCAASPSMATWSTSRPATSSSPTHPTSAHRLLAQRLPATLP